MTENQPLSLEQKGLSSIKRIRIVRSVPFRFSGINVAETGDALLGIVYDCPPLSQITPRRLTSSWGVTSDPVDNEQVELMLGFGDPDSGQAVGSIRNRAIWQDIIRWKVITSIGIFQVIDRQPEVIFTPRDEYSNIDLASRSTRLALSFYGFTNQAATIIAIMGNLALSVVLFQRVWKGQEVAKDEDWEDAEWDESDDYDFDGGSS